MKDNYYQSSRPVMRAKAVVSAFIIGLFFYAFVWGMYILIDVLTTSPQP